MNTFESISNSPDLASELAKRSADRAEQAVSATRKAVSNTAAAVSDGLDSLQESGENAFTKAASQADELARKGMDQARRASAALRQTAQQTGDRTVTYIRDEPVKSVLLAAAVGGLIALALSRHSSR